MAVVRYITHPDVVIDPVTPVPQWRLSELGRQRRRIVTALEDLLDAAAAGPDIAVVGHGGVGTLWYCHLAGVPIERRWDQPGQGHYLTVDGASRRRQRGWRPIEQERWQRR